MAKPTSRKLEPRLRRASAAMKKQFAEMRRKVPVSVAVAILDSAPLYVER